MVSGSAHSNSSCSRLPTYDDEEDEADDKERGAADGHPAGEVDERRQQQRGPEQEVKQRP